MNIMNIMKMGKTVMMKTDKTGMMKTDKTGTTKDTHGRPISAIHGEWGERIAAERLRMEGLVIVERNSRPLARNQRLEIDIIAYDPRSDTMVFVEVKQHSRHFLFERRLRSIDARKRKNMRVACAAWRRANRWEGDCRFDVIEVFGTPETRHPEIDHIQHVYLHTPSIDSVEWV